MGVYFIPTSVINFCQGFSCCPYYRGVRNSRVSARRELTVLSFQSGVRLKEVFNNRNYPNTVHFSVRVCLIEVSAE